jgi:hypothetical protein
MIPTTQKLIEEAASRKLNTKERRQCVVYLTATDPDITNTDLAQMFRVTERTIRMDKQAFRKEKAQFIKEDDVGLIIADIALDYERQIRDIEKSKAKCKLGTKEYLAHCTSAMELRLKMVKQLQDLGYYPKNLGQMTVERFDWKAEVNLRDGSVNTRRLTMFDGDDMNVIEAELVETKKLEAGKNAPQEEHNSGSEAVTSTEPSGESQTSKADTPDATPQTS